MIGRVANIDIKPYEPPPGVVGLADLFTAVRQRHYAMLLLSGGELDCAGYSLMGWDPFLVLRAKGRRVEVKQDGGTRVSYQAEFEPDFWVPGFIGRQFAGHSLRESTLELFTNVERHARGE